MIAVKERADASIPTPPAGKSRIFVSSDDGKWKVKKSSGVIVSLEDAALGLVDAVDVTYTTTDSNYWLWAVSVPVEVREGLDILAEEVGRIGNLVDLLAPDKAALLGTLVVTGITFYQGKIADGLNPSWYTVNSAGDVITNLVYDATFIISADDFRAGEKDTPSTYGALSDKLDGVIEDTHDMTTGIGTTGDVTVSDISVFNNFWSSADGQAAVDLSSEGYHYVNLEHTEAGTSNPVAAHFDDNIILPTFISALNVILQTKVSKWLSGIEYYGLNSSFLITFNIIDLFRKVYTNNGVIIISCTGLNDINLDPVSIPQSSDNFFISNEAITLDKIDECDLNPDMTATATKPNNTSAATSIFSILGLGFAINTYGIVSTNTLDIFQDEDKRLEALTTNAFDSTALLTNGEALVRCGILNYGDAQYPSKTGDQRYERFITKAVASSGTIAFSGINVSDIDAYGTGDINILLKLDDETVYFDLSRAFGDNAGNGNTEATALGGQVSAVGSILSWTIGTYSTANNANQYRIIIIFRNNTENLTSITTG